MIARACDLEFLADAHCIVELYRPAAPVGNAEHGHSIAREVLWVGAQ
jgi:hypothetical protein